VTSIQHQVGATKVDFTVHEALKQYTTDNYMGGVDDMDKNKQIGGSFTTCAMFSCHKEWV
jgi:hypothetical protein